MSSTASTDLEKLSVKPKCIDIDPMLCLNHNQLHTTLPLTRNKTPGVKPITGTVLETCETQTDRDWK